MHVLAGLPGGLEIFVFGWLIIILLPLIFYLLSLQKALDRCSTHNRTMSPGQVWLMLIPLFGVAWHFVVVFALSNSLGAEFAERSIPVEPEPGKTLGLAMCILGVCSLLPYLGILAALAFLVVWILYWVKIAGFSAQLAA